MNDLGSRLDSLAADAVRTFHLHDPSRVGNSRPVSNLNPRLILAVGAAILLMAGLIYRGQGQDPRVTSLVADEGEEIEPQPELALNVPVAQPGSTFVLPAPEEWVMVNHRILVEPVAEAAEVWTWRVDDAGDKLVILVSGPYVDEGQASSPQVADVRSESGRSVMGWISEANVPVGFAGIGIDSATTADLANRLERTADGWSLPGASLVTSEVASYRGGEREAGEYSKVDDRGATNLQERVRGIVRTASTGSLFLELFDASRHGTVETIEIAGHNGFFIAGSGIPFAWAGVAVDGRIFTWELRSGGAGDVRAAATSMAPVTEAEWDAAINSAPAETAAAIEVDTSAIDPSRIPPPVALPRFLLPDGWSMGAVTDKGIWTSEQRAQEHVLNPYVEPRSRDSILQAFGRVGGGAADDLVPAAVVSMEFSEYANTMDQLIDGETPLEVGDLRGAIVLDTALLFNDSASASVRAPRLTQVELLAFLGEMQPRGRGVLGFDVADDRYALMFEIPDSSSERDAGQSLGEPVDSWSASWVSDAGTAATIDVDMMSFMDFQFEAALVLESEEVVGRADGGVIVGGGGRNFWRYDTATDVLVSLTLDASASDESVRDLFDALIPIDIAAWTELAQPFNIDPSR